MKEFIKDLLEKVKDYEEGVLIPNEVQLKISEIENFNPLIAYELAKIEETILTEKNFSNNEITSVKVYKVKLLNYSEKDNLLTFYPTALKNYLKKLNNE